MKKAPFDPARFDHNETFISGIPVHIYNTAPLKDYLSQFDFKKETSHLTKIPIKVLYLIHGRYRNYTDTESMGYYMTDKYYKLKGDVDIPLVFVTFDVSNHGSRLLNKSANNDWAEGNKNHALDMVSIIDDSVLKLKLIMDYLPFYLNLDSFVPKLTDYKFEFSNVVSGYSLGGHIIHRFVDKYPDSVDVIIPFIGSSDISSLMIDRLLKVSPTGSKRYLQDYDELKFTDEQKLLYPKSFHEYVSSIDQSVSENFPFGRIKMFAAYGSADPIVPPAYSKLFCSLHKIGDPDTEVFYQEGVGHDVTLEMLDKSVEWLVKFY
ncbi:hypothetical protein PSN45_003343 [Yamadazyma tenuis]|nr:hypothetical protein PSN45_003343 [Yamadazyma tenuis]